MKPSKEDEKRDKLPEPLVPAANEAERLVKEALSKIDKRMHEPAGRAADAAGELSTRSQLTALLKDLGDSQKKILWSSLKAAGAGALALIPLLGEAEGGAIAAGDMADAAILEGATSAQARALASGSKVLETGEVASPLAKIIGKEAATRLGKVLKVIDPFEDIPPFITVASGGAEAVGLHGAAAVPAALQLLVNEYKTVRNTAGTASKAGQIILKSPELQHVKDFGASVMTNIRDRVTSAASPRMRQAAGAFA